MSLLPNLGQGSKGKIVPNAPQQRYAENRLLPVRMGTRGPLSYFEQSQTISRSLIASLPFDIILASLVVPASFPPHLIEFMRTASLGLLVIAAMFIFRERILDGTDKLRKLQHYLSSLGTKHSKAVIGIIIAITLAELAVRLGNIGVFAVLAGLVVAYRAYKALDRTLAEQQLKLEALERDRTLLLDNLNRQIFLFSLMPLGCARTASLLAALVVLSTTHNTLDWLPYGASALVLLVALFPEQEDFLIRCKRCSRWTSRALKTYGFCPICSREEFQIKASPKEDTLPKKPGLPTSQPASASKPVPGTSRLLERLKARAKP